MRISIVPNIGTCGLLGTRDIRTLGFQNHIMEQHMFLLKSIDSEVLHVGIVERVDLVVYVGIVLLCWCNIFCPASSIQSIHSIC